jgi:hypothetical protein
MSFGHADARIAHILKLMNKTLLP